MNRALTRCRKYVAWLCPDLSTTISEANRGVRSANVQRAYGKSTAMTIQLIKLLHAFTTTMAKKSRIYLEIVRSISGLIRLVMHNQVAIDLMAQSLPTHKQGVSQFSGHCSWIQTRTMWHLIGHSHGDDRVLQKRITLIWHYSSCQTVQQEWQRHVRIQRSSSTSSMCVSLL